MCYNSISVVAPSGSGGTTVIFMTSVGVFCLWALGIMFASTRDSRWSVSGTGCSCLYAAWGAMAARRVTRRASPHVLKARGVKGLLLRCSVPTVVKVAVASLCGVVSDVFVKRNMKTVTVSNLTVAFPLVGLIMTFYMLVSTNKTAVSSVHLKRGSVRNTARILNGALVLYLVGSMMFNNVTFVFLSPVLGFFNTDPTALPCTHSFVRMVLLNAPIACAVVKLGGMVHTAKCPGGTVLASLMAMLTGMVVTPVFVFRFR